VKEAAQLLAVQRDVGRVHVQHDLGRRQQVLLHEGLDQELLDLRQVGDDLLVPAVGLGADGGEFQAVERALAGQGGAAIAGARPVLAGGVGLASQHGQQRIVAQPVVVVEVFVAQAQAEDALLEQLRDGVFDQVGVAVVGETSGELVEEMELRLDFAEQQAAAIAGDGPAVESSDDLPGTEVVKSQRRAVTVCHDRMAPSGRRK
jgi:hypothetical protein